MHLSRDALFLPGLLRRFRYQVCHHDSEVVDIEDTVHVWVFQVESAEDQTIWPEGSFLLLGDVVSE